MASLRLFKWAHLLHYLQTINFSMTMASSSSSLIIISSLLLSLFLAVPISEAEPTAPLVAGLSWNFYKSKCPKVESIVRKQLKKIFKEDIGQAAGLLRLHFHDCFVQVYTSYSLSVSLLQVKSEYHMVKRSYHTVKSQ